MLVNVNKEKAVGTASALVYIVLVNWNGWRDTVECLESLRNLAYDNFRTIIVDNKSGDDSVRNILRWSVGEIPVQVPPYIAREGCAHSQNEAVHVDVIGENAYAVNMEMQPNGGITIIEANDNRGFASGCNIGIKYALGDPACKYVWLLNNDTVVEKNALTCLVNKYSGGTKYGMCGSTLLYYSNPEFIQSLGGKFNPVFAVNKQCFVDVPLKSVENIDEGDIESRIDYVVGASLLISRKFLESVGLLDEGLFFYFEELDWYFRSQRHYTTGYAKDSLVYHKVGQSIEREKTCIGAEHYYWVRNRILLTKKYHPGMLMFVCLHVVAAILKKTLSADWKFCSVTLAALYDGLNNKTGKRS